MAKRRKAKRSGGKKRRTAAQKAATRRMVAANRSKRGGGGTKKRRTKKRASAKRHTHWGKVSSHKRRVNPRRKSAHRYHYKTRRHTNPGSAIKDVVIGALAGLALTAGGTALARVVSPQNAPTISKALGALGVGAGLYFAKKKPILATGLLTGAVVGTVGPMISAKLEGMAAQSPEAKQMAAVRLMGVKYLEGLGAVTANDMGAVTANDMGYLPQGPYGMGEAHGVRQGW
jgi:hypothetical protein